LSLVLLLTGCDNTSYKAITKNGLEGSYSFQYPASFEDDINPSNFTGASIFHRAQSTNPASIDQAIIISIGAIDVSREHLSPQQIVDNIIIGYGENPDSKIQLFEKSSVRVSGVNGQLIRYWGIGGYPRMQMTIDPRRWYKQEVYLEREGMLWAIGLYSLDSLTEESKPEFDHLIRTFKILK
jgi:hypothetical protein